MVGRKRRTWSDEDQRTICQQTTAPGVSIAQVARRYALNANQIFNWLKDERFALSPDEPDTSVFLPIDICGEPTADLFAPVLESAKVCPPNGSGHSHPQGLMY
jgi:transposase